MFALLTAAVPGLPAWAWRVLAYALLVAALVGGLSARMRRLQNGFVRTYALTMLAGVVAVLGALAVTR